ncbi:MAG: hypothetical protein ACRD2L_26505, partial [Terriglobia bacterium]
MAVVPAQGSETISRAAVRTAHDLDSGLMLGQECLYSFCDLLPVVIYVPALAASTVTQSQLLRPYPQYTGVSSSASFAIAQNMGSSTYHSALVRVERRFSQGIQLSLAYTGSKLIDNASGRIFGVNGNSTPVQNFYDLNAERSVSEGDVPRRLVLSHTVELPFGKGRRFLSGAPAVVNLLTGGWSLSGIASYS